MSDSPVTISFGYVSELSLTPTYLYNHMGGSMLTLSSGVTLLNVKHTCTSIFVQMNNITEAVEYWEMYLSTVTCRFFNKLLICLQKSFEISTRFKKAGS